MAKKKKESSNGQQFMSPEAFVRNRARRLEIGKCFVSKSLFDTDGEGYVVVSRNHTGGKVSLACFLVDVLCLGVKDSYFRLRLDTFDFEELLGRLEEATEMRECSYNEAHNIIYGAIAFAEEAEIKPHKSFEVTKYMLEEDDEAVPLIEYDFGKDGKHFLIASDKSEASKYLPKLRKLYGNDFRYLVPFSSFGYDDSEYEKSPTYGETTKYTYNPPTYATELKLHHPWVNEELGKPQNSLAPDDELTDRILALPKEELREDLENIILYYTTLTRDGIIPAGFETDEHFNGIIPVSLALLAEVGNADSSLDVVLECMRQSDDFSDYHFGDFADCFVEYSLMKLGKDRLGQLLDFMKEEGLSTYLKCLVPETVVRLGTYNPERKAESVEWFKKLLAFATEVVHEVKYIDYELAALIASYSVKLGAPELLPYIRALYATGCVDQGVQGSIDDVEDMFDNEDYRQDDIKDMPLEIHEYFRYLKDRLGNL